MTVEQTGTILGLLEGAFPHAFPDDQAKRKALRLWAEVFAEDRVQDVKAAAIAYVNTAGKSFFPTPGQIRAKLPQKACGPSKAADAPLWQKQRMRLERYEALKRRRREAGLPESVYEARQAGMSCEEYDRLVEAAGLGLEVIF